MTRRLVGLLAVMLAASTASGQKASIQDRPGFKDPGLFARMPGYFLSERSSFKESRFDSYTFRVRRGTRDASERIEGHLLVYSYVFDRSSGKPRASPLQIARNYQNAAVAVGGEVLYDGQDAYATTTLRVARNGQESWAEVRTVGDGLGYYVTIVERQAMAQEVVADAEALGRGLTASGHVEVPGILFDFNKAEIKPESEPALQQVAKLLQASPSLNVWVVGHTDWVGSSEANDALSGARAAAVVKALTQQFGIDPKRLAPHGVGPFAPVSTNATEEGRAKNRRVELVAQP
jgi:OOP family OmpA-OmpF porin